MPIYFTLLLLWCYNGKSNRLFHNKLYSALFLNCNKKLYRSLTYECRFSAAFAPLRGTPHFRGPNGPGRLTNVTQVTIFRTVASFDNEMASLGPLFHRDLHLLNL